MRLFPRRPRPLPAAVLGLMMLCGCAEGPPTPPEAAEAKATLERALAAWRDGETIESQKNEDPALVVSDSKWERGERLSRFEIRDPPRPSGAQQKFRVDLWLVDARGKEKKDAADYEVGLAPVRTVFRAMFQ